MIGIFYQNGEPVAPFTTFLELSYSNNSNVAFEPLESGRFSSDSKQPTPGIVSVIATQVMLLVPDEISNTINTLDQLSRGTTLLNIVFKYSSYIDMNLISFDHDLTPEKTILYASLTFQEIRMTSAQYGKLPKNKVKDPKSASPQNRGLQQGKQVDQSILVGQFGFPPTS